MDVLSSLAEGGVNACDLATYFLVQFVQLD